MAWKFVCPPLSSPMLVFTIKSNEIISWTEIFFHRPHVKIVTLKIAHFSVASQEKHK